MVKSGKGSQNTKDTAETLAIAALGFLASDPERLERFLTLSGLAPQNLRVAAATPGFLAGVLEHISSDERLLLAFARDANCDPAAIARARATLAGAPPDWSP